MNPLDASIDGPHQRSGALREHRGVIADADDDASSGRAPEAAASSARDGKARSTWDAQPFGRYLHAGGRFAPFIIPPIDPSAPAFVVAPAASPLTSDWQRAAA